jgi:integrase
MRPTEGHGYVDLDRGVFYRRAEGARETKKRQPPVRLPDRLLTHMRRWAKTPLEIKTKARGKSKSVGRMISHDYVVEWNGEPVQSVKKSFRAACEAAGLGWHETIDGKEVFRTDVTPHILRHTAATWLMQAGVDPWKAAGFLGMSVETLIDTYSHHHLDFQVEAAERITAKPPAFKVKSNVVRQR